MIQNQSPPSTSKQELTANMYDRFPPPPLDLTSQEPVYQNIGPDSPLDSHYETVPKSVDGYVCTDIDDSEDPGYLHPLPAECVSCSDEPGYINVPSRTPGSRFNVLPQSQEAEIKHTSPQCIRKDVGDSQNKKGTQKDIVRIEDVDVRGYVRMRDRGLSATSRRSRTPEPVTIEVPLNGRHATVKTSIINKKTSPLPAPIGEPTDSRLNVRDSVFPPREPIQEPLYGVHSEVKSSNVISKTQTPYKQNQNSIYGKRYDVTGINLVDNKPPLPERNRDSVYSKQSALSKNTITYGSSSSLYDPLQEEIYGKHYGVKMPKDTESRPPLPRRNPESMYIRSLEFTNTEGDTLYNPLQQPIYGEHTEPKSRNTSGRTPQIPDRNPHSVYGKHSEVRRTYIPNTRIKQGGSLKDGKESTYGTYAANPVYGSTPDLRNPTQNIAWIHTPPPTRSATLDRILHGRKMGATRRERLRSIEMDDDTCMKSDDDLLHYATIDGEPVTDTSKHAVNARPSGRVRAGAPKIPIVTPTSHRLITSIARNTSSNC